MYSRNSSLRCALEAASIRQTGLSIRFVNPSLRLPTWQQTPLGTGRGTQISCYVELTNVHVCGRSKRDNGTSTRQQNPIGTGRVPQVRLSVPGPNKTGDPDFLYAARDKTTCAAFSKESRMNFANATKLHRKSRGSPTKVFATPATNAGCPIQAEAVLWLEWDSGSRCGHSQLQNGLEGHISTLSDLPNEQRQQALPTPPPPRSDPLPAPAEHRRIPHR